MEQQPTATDAIETGDVYLARLPEWEPIDEQPPERTHMNGYAIMVGMEILSGEWTS